MVTLETKFAVLAVFLLAHGFASWKKWYYTKPEIDMITHFLGGLAVSAFIKDWYIAIALIIGWDILEMLLVNKRWKMFRESPMNKARDIAIGTLGFLLGVDVL